MLRRNSGEALTSLPTICCPATDQVLHIPVLQEQSLLAYQQTVLTALQDVENALIASAKEADHLKALAEAVAANRKAVQLSTQLYTEGQIDFLNVLNAQRSLFVSEDALVQSTGNISTDRVSLYKALGGGWTDAPLAQTNATEQVAMGTDQ